MPTAEQLDNDLKEAIDESSEEIGSSKEELIQEALDRAKDVGINRDQVESHCQYKFGCGLDELDKEQLKETADLFWEAAGADQPSERVRGQAYRKDLIQQKEVRRKFSPEEIEQRKDMIIDCLDELEELQNDRNHFLQKNTAAKNEEEDLLERLHHEVRDGYETAERTVRIERDFEAGLRMIYDKVTDEFLGSEPLTAGDRQLDALEDVEENERREEEAEFANANGNGDISEEEQPA